MCIIHSNRKSPSRGFRAMSPGMGWYMGTMDRFADKRGLFGLNLIEGEYITTNARGRSIMDGEGFINAQVKARLLQAADGNADRALEALRSNAIALDEVLASLLAPVYASISYQMRAMDARHGWRGVSFFRRRFASSSKRNNDPYLKQATENLKKIEDAFSRLGSSASFATLLPAPEREVR